MSTKMWLYKTTQQELEVASKEGTQHTISGT